MLRFLHVADLHLGLRITRYQDAAVDKIREARLQALQRVRQECREGDFQFVIVAGDLFDDAHVTTDIAVRAFDMFRSFEVPVYVLPGNHDPLQAGAVWDLDPWKSAVGSNGNVHLLHSPAPLEIGNGVTLFPCPVYRKNSTRNPTTWIGDHRRNGSAGYRIGVAHGSVMDRPTLPDDDHPISPTAPDDLDLDYLALGHWHNHREFPDSQGAPRMAYSGVHEPMRFQDDPEAAGWRPYSAGAAREEFIDRGPGTAIAVSLAEPGARPQLELRRVGYYQWTTRECQLESIDDLARLIDDVSEFPTKERTLLRLRLTGTLSLAGMSRVDILRSVLTNYVVGELDDSGLQIEPDEAELQEAIGSGVLSQVYDRLKQQSEEDSETDRLVAQRAIELLYRLHR